MHEIAHWSFLKFPTVFPKYRQNPKLRLYNYKMKEIPKGTGEEGRGTLTLWKGPTRCSPA